MTTATQEDLDLSWVTFSGDSRPPCECHTRTAEGAECRCPAEAVCEIVTDHVDVGILACIEHRDEAVGNQQRYGFCGLCPRCNNPVRIIQIVPLR